MKGFRLHFTALVVSAALCSCSALTYLGYRISPDYPEDDRDEVVAISGLSSPVQIYYDSLGIPHIRADNEIDLVTAVGFAQARARFFQMDTIRRYARGRLAELVGDAQGPLGSVADLDAAMRAWGFDRAAENEAATLDAKSATLLQAYADGVNQALSMFKPIEYRLLQVEPKPWTISDTFAVGHMISWGITHNWRHEMCRLLLALSAGYERAEKIFPSRPWPGPASISGEDIEKALPPSVVPEIKALFPPRPVEIGADAKITARTLNRLFLSDLETVGASNGWVMGGGFTVSGHPVVAGDPHLAHTLPSLAFQQHMRSPEMDVIGMTIPGIPYVLIGHNHDVAWTLTSAVADVTDLYLEKPGLKDGMVEGPDGPEPLVTWEETIKVRVGDRFEEKKIALRRTKRGPLINDMYKGLLPEAGPLVSIRGLSLGASHSILALRRAAAARDVHELRQAFTKMLSPVNVVTAADSKGETAIFPTGTVPVRRHHRGTFPVPAWISDYAWTKTADPSELPYAFGGKDDFFVHTNNMLAHYADQAVLYQVDSAPSYRFERISELISAESRHCIESETRIQGDVFLVRARRLVPLILKDLKSFSPRTRIQQKALSALSSWNGYASQDSIGCAVFWELYRTAAERALEDEVPPDVLSYLLSFRYFSNAIDLWFEDMHHPVWDDTRTRTIEDRRHVLTESFKTSVARLTAELGPDVSTWTWGRLHYMEPRHLFGSKVSGFNLDPWPAPGGAESVWKAHFDMGEDDAPFKDKYGPVFRMVVDLGDIDHGLWVVDSGTSGWPGSPHYQDQYELWKQTKYAPMTSNWKQIVEQARCVLLLEPR